MVSLYISISILKVSSDLVCYCLKKFRNDNVLVTFLGNIWSPLSRKIHNIERQVVLTWARIQANILLFVEESSFSTLFLLALGKTYAQKICKFLWKNVLNFIGTVLLNPLQRSTTGLVLCTLLCSSYFFEIWRVIVWFWPDLFLVFSHCCGRDAIGNQRGYLIHCVISLCSPDWAFKNYD